jgi:hypothetical protein
MKIASFFNVSKIHVIDDFQILIFFFQRIKIGGSLILNFLKNWNHQLLSFFKLHNIGTVNPFYNHTLPELFFIVTLMNCDSSMYSHIPYKPSQYCDYRQKICKIVLYVRIKVPTIV